MARRFSIPRGISPSLAKLMANLLQAERLWVIASDKYGDDSEQDKATWRGVEKAERAICRTRCRTLADLGAKLRLDAYMGGVGCGAVSSLYASALRDAQGSRAKGGAA